MTWNCEYMDNYDNIQIKGYSASEGDCQTYFSKRVSAKIIENDSSEQLRAHLEELETTGFDSCGLIEHMSESAPQLKDWEIGEVIAEAALEDQHDVVFPWETGWDKRTLKASLPGADIVGFQSKDTIRFIFGQVKSSSEQRIPPQVVNAVQDGLGAQMYQLAHSTQERIQLIQWLLPRTKGTPWEHAYADALEQYIQKDYCLVGVLVSGGREVNARDLSCICPAIRHSPDDGDVLLLGYYLPFDKNEWAGMVPIREVTQ